VCCKNARERCHLEVGKQLIEVRECIGSIEICLASFHSFWRRGKSINKKILSDILRVVPPWLREKSYLSYFWGPIQQTLGGQFTILEDKYTQIHKFLEGKYTQIHTFLEDKFTNFWRTNSQIFGGHIQKFLEDKFTQIHKILEDKLTQINKILEDKWTQIHNFLDKFKTFLWENASHKNKLVSRNKLFFIFGANSTYKQCILNQLCTTAKCANAVFP
jgi:hypothetical protein